MAVGEKEQEKKKGKWKRITRKRSRKKEQCKGNKEWEIERQGNEERKRNSGQGKNPLSLLLAITCGPITVGYPVGWYICY